MVFFDADRFSAPIQLRIILPQLTPDVFLLADNGPSHPEELAGYVAAIEALPNCERIPIAIGKGFSLAYHSGSLWGIGAQRCLEEPR